MCLIAEPVNTQRLLEKLHPIVTVWKVVKRIPNSIQSPHYYTPYYCKRIKQKGWMRSNRRWYTPTIERFFSLPHPYYSVRKGIHVYLDKRTAVGMSHILQGDVVRCRALRSDLVACDGLQSHAVFTKIYVPKLDI